MALGGGARADPVEKTGRGAAIFAVMGGGAVKRVGLRKLKWLTFAVAVAGVAALDVVLYLSHPGARPMDAAVRGAALGLAILVFNEYAFGLVARRDTLLEQERERLYALHQISRGLALLPGVDRNLTHSLDVLRRVTGADIAAWLEPVGGGGAVCRAAVGESAAGFVRAGAALPAPSADRLWRLVRGGRTVTVADPERAQSLGLPDFPPLPGERLAAAVAVGAGGPEPLGAVVVGWRAPHTMLRADQEFVENVASLLGVAVENQRLYRETQRMGALEERERIARDMHDGLAQALTYLKLKAETALAQAHSGSAPALESALRAIRNGAVEALGDVRQALLDLRTPEGDGDFVSALAHQVEAWSQFHDIAAEVLLPPGPVRMAPDTGAQVLRIVQEALANVRKHAQAKRVTVRLAHEPGALVVTVTDDGRGFDVRRAGRSGHFGLGILRDRAAAIGGLLHIDSRPGSGTDVVLHLPDAPGRAAEPAALPVAASVGGRT